MPRHQYRLSLTSPEHDLEPLRTARFELRQPTLNDVDALAELVLEAYRGTIDDEGEELSAARAFVVQSFNEQPLLEASWLACAAGVPVAALLLRRWREQPLVTFVVTQPAYKGQRVAEQLVRRALTSLVNAGETQLVAFITEGNAASERLFARLGFQRVSAG